MRDPNRIKPFCEELAKTWEIVPDQRFGQFFDNFYSWVYDKYDFKGKDIWNYEDDELLELLKEFRGEDVDHEITKTWAENASGWTKEENE